MDGMIPDRYGGERPKSSLDDFPSKILIPLGSVLIAAVVFLSTSNKLPLWASIVVVAYLAFVVVWVSARPTTHVISKMMIGYGQRRFAKEMSRQLRGFVDELNIHLSRDRTNTLTYLIHDFASKLPEDVRFTVRLDRNSREFDILQCWAIALRDGCGGNKLANFRRNAAEFATIAFRWSCACTYLREDVQMCEGTTEVTAHRIPDLKPDWDAAANKVAEFLSRVERFANTVNAKYGARICPDSFQEVKPL